MVKLKGGLIQMSLKGVYIGAVNRVGAPRPTVP
jgi:hypothetical protein